MAASTTTSRSAAIAIAALIALLGFATAVALSAGSADAKQAKVIGKTKKTPDASCPNDCQVFATVTGFQTVADGSSGVMKVPSNGTIVAWAVNLGDVDEADVEIFDGYFPDNKFKGFSSARLAILKPKGKAKYKLVKQSPPMELKNKLGSEPIFTLKKPLKVKKGQRVAITSVTWASMFAMNLPSNDNQWIASREKGECGGQANAKKAKPQQKVGSTRKYGCRFKASRLLYWAYFVPSGKKK